MKYNFIVLSNQFFDSPLKTNKWYVSTHLSKRGNNVIFLDPPVRYRAMRNYIKNPSIDLRKLFSMTNKVNDNLMVYSQTNLFNFFPFSSFNTWVHSKIINRLIKNTFDPNLKTILYIYHFDYPDLENLIPKVKFDLMIYDCVDEYSAFPEYLSKKKINLGLVGLIQRLDESMKIKFNQNNKFGKEWVDYREKFLTSKAGLVFASAPGLVKKLGKYKSPVYFLPNAGEAEVFDVKRVDVAEPEDILQIPHPRIGFSGAIDAYKNNIDLIEKSAEKYPSYHFVLIGPERVSDPDLNLTKLKSMNNVHFLGIKPWEKMPSYYIYFDAYFIPYNLNDYTVNGCFPVKYFEALAAGLPTVVTNLPAYTDYDIDGFVSKTDDDFINNLRVALEENNEEKIAKRKLLASKNTWDGKTNKIIDLVDKYFNE